MTTKKRTFNLNGNQLPCPSEDYDESDYIYNDTVICPRCGSDNGTESVVYEETEQEQDCCVCKGKYKLTLNFTVDYSTEVIGERLTR